MASTDWTTSPPAKAYQDLQALGLESYLSELHTFGFTVVPPEALDADDLVDRLERRLIEVSADRNGGVKPDLEVGSTHTGLLGAVGQHLFYLLADDPVFREQLLHPAVLAFATHLVGPSVVLSSCTAMLKGRGRRPLALHTDSPLFAPNLSLVCNVTWLLSDYTKENGALCFVPGSHLLGRQPTLGENFTSLRGALTDPAEWGAEEGTTDEAPGAVPVIAPKGSLVVWHGNTWHGAYNRIAPGLRLNLINYFASPHLRTQEAYREMLPQDVIDSEPERFARLMGSGITYGWTEEGPQASPGAAFDTHRRRSNALA